MTSERAASATPDASLFNLLPIGVVYHDANGRIADANRAALAILGITREELLRRQADPAWNPCREDGTPMPPDERPSQVAMRQGRPVRSALVRFERHDTREPRWLVVDAIPEFRDGDSSPWRVLTTLIDVTDRRRDEEQAVRWQRLFAQTELGVALANARDNTFIEVNEAFARQRGYTRGELAGRPVATIYAPESREAQQQRFAEIDACGQLTFESLHLCKDGSRLPVFMEVSTIRDADGTPLSRVALALDLSQQRRAEASAEAAAAELRLAVAAGNVGLWDWDLQSGRMVYSPEWKRQIGYAPDEIGDTFDEWRSRVHPDDLDATEARVRNYLANPVGLHQVVFRFRHRDGSYRWILAQGAIERDRDGNARRMLGSHVDITDRKRAEEELQQRNEELTRFTYAVSHDLKSPLVTIRTFLGYLEHDIRAGDRDRMALDFDYIRRAAERMTVLLDELLQLSRVGRTGGAHERLDLAPIVHDALSLVAGAIAARGVAVAIRDLPAVVHGDRTRLVELFQNLIDNAVKFMGDQPAPSIEVGGHEVPEGVECFVRDNGMGIDPRHVGKLFGLFEKLDATSEGSGMGLALAKRIVEVHGGRVWAESAGRGHGTTFRFTLPRAPRA